MTWKDLLDMSFVIWLSYPNIEYFMKNSLAKFRLDLWGCDVLSPIVI